MSDAPGYKEAMEEIERIVEEIESEAIDVDVLSEKIKRAAFLIKYCRQKLRKTDDEIKKVLQDLESEDIAGDHS
jgi:exodeoxyribonuclease VII small subunit